MLKKRNFKKGFSLIELLTVIVVLGLLLLIAVPTVSKLVENSKNKAFLYDANTFIDMAKKNHILSDSKLYVFNIQELSDEKYISPYGKEYIGNVYLERDTGEYYIYITDGIKEIGKITDEYIEPVLYQNLLDYNLANFDSSTQEIKSNITAVSIDNYRYVNSEIGTDDDDVPQYFEKIIEKGTKGYLHYIDSNNEEICKPFTVLKDDGNEMLLLEKGLNRRFYIGTNKLNGADFYSQELSYRNFTVSDVLYYFDIDSIERINDWNYDEKLPEAKKVYEEFINTFVSESDFNSLKNKTIPFLVKSSDKYVALSFFYNALGFENILSFKNYFTKSYKENISNGYLNYVITVPSNDVYSDSNCSSFLHGEG